MSLGTEQRKFSLALAKLIIYIYERGYEVSMGDVFRDQRMHGIMGVKKGYGHKNSCHKLKLAADLNVFKDGKYLINEEAEEAHHIIHDKWDKLGGSERILHDLNHYSFEWKGMR